MKILSSSAELEQDASRAESKSRRISWGVYLVGAVCLLVLWFVDGSVVFSYLFGGWIMTGALMIWLTEDTEEY